MYAIKSYSLGLLWIYINLFEKFPSSQPNNDIIVCTEFYSPNS